ncbi:MAG TPA: hypothetical protein VIH25_10275 [Steroidobacteraceae bacterium]
MFRTTLRIDRVDFQGTPDAAGIHADPSLSAEPTSVAGIADAM